MSHRVEVHPAAAHEAARARRWYAEIDADLGERFALELREVLTAVSVRPRSFALHREGTRRAAFHGFPYAVVFREVGSAVRVLAVMHERRRPAYWSSRR